jgi:membrane protein required for colicin V production
MNLLDVLIAIGILVGVVRGLATGMIRQMAGLIALVIAFAVGIHVMGPIGDRLGDSVGIPSGMARVLVFIIVVIAAHVLLAIAGRALEAVAGALRLTSVNRALGGVIGGLKAALILSIALLVLAFFDVPASQSRAQSVLYAPVAGLLPEAWDLLAEQLPVIKGVADEFGRDVADRLDIDRNDQ